MSQLQQDALFKQDAILIFDQVLNLDGQHLNSFIRKGYCLRKCKLYKESIDLSDLGLKYFPDNVELIYNKGEALLLIYKEKESLVWFERALKVDP